MDLPLTLGLTALAVGAAVLFGWLGARPLDLAKGEPRMIPWRWLMLAAATLAFVLFIHVLNLLGMRTGSG